jgi:iron complex transport system permease protein
LVLVFILAIYGLTFGAKKVSIFEVFKTLLSSEETSQQQILMYLRLPRLVAAIVSGTTLGLAGAIMQIVLRNPLGSPFTLGIANASAFGAALAYTFMGSSFVASLSLGFIGQHLVVTTSAFIWSTIGALFILYISRKKVLPLRI